MKNAAFLLVAISMVAGCSLLGLGDSRTYTYTAFDASGAALAEGMLEMDFGKKRPDGDRLIEGSWSIQRLLDSARVGPQIGSGELAGEQDDGYVSINLHPDVEPQFGDEVVLSGELLSDGSRIEGRWTFYRHAGPTRSLATGAFEAVRR